jgi:hypothetical protein
VQRGAALACSCDTGALLVCVKVEAKVRAVNEKHQITAELSSALGDLRSRAVGVFTDVSVRLQVRERVSVSVSVSLCVRVAGDVRVLSLAAVA